MAGLIAAAAAGGGRAVRILDKSLFPGLRVIKAPCWASSRKMGTQEGSAQKLNTQTSDNILKIPGYRPTAWDRKILVWTGRFKKIDDVPATLPFETVDAARNKMRVKISYIMIALTISGCIVMVILGKRAVSRHETLTNLNIERKARLRDEGAQGASDKP
uniref:Family with sequence similarity 162 member A n=1 Tax=Salvator merianae TaxID=96440 RepID=A0A8D0BWP3_SALMN